MLSDEEGRTLEATAALLALDDPHLAAQLGQHRLIPPRHPERDRPAPEPEPESAPVPAPPPARAWWRRPAVWPPVLLFVFCLMLLFLPALLAP